MTDLALTGTTLTSGGDSRLGGRCSYSETDACVRVDRIYVELIHWCGHWFLAVCVRLWLVSEVMCRWSAVSVFRSVLSVLWRGCLHRMSECIVAVTSFICAELLWGTLSHVSTRAATLCLCVRVVYCGRLSFSHSLPLLLSECSLRPPPCLRIVFVCAAQRQRNSRHRITAPRFKCECVLAPNSTTNQCSSLSLFLSTLILSLSLSLNATDSSAGCIAN